MKKWIALILTLTLTLSVTAFAKGTTEQDGSPTDVTARITTSITPSYTVTIPEDVKVTFNKPSTEFGVIELTSAQIDPGYVVKVALTASGKLVNAADASKTIAYVVNSASGAFTSAEYRFAGDSTALTIDITQAAWDAAYAGYYSDTVTFTISYGEARKPLIGSTAKWVMKSMEKNIISTAGSGFGLR